MSCAYCVGDFVTWVWAVRGNLRVQALSDPDAPCWSYAVCAHLLLERESLHHKGDDFMCLECKCKNLII